MMPEQQRKISIEKLHGMTRRGERLVMLTVYDFVSATIADNTGIDIAFVGDSLAMLMLGYSSTVPVSLDEMLVFMKAVSRGAGIPLLLGDLPFGSYLTVEQGIHSAARIIQEGGMDAVKLEGGANSADVVAAIVRRGIPVMSHIGLTPQTSGAHGGFRVKGRRAGQAMKLVDDALALEEAGAFGVVLELVPDEVAHVISDRLTIPTIGIGSGAHCDGQVLVWHDLLGLSPAYGRHARRYADLSPTIATAISTFVSEVRAGDFPSEDETWHMAPEEIESFNELAGVLVSG